MTLSQVKYVLYIGQLDEQVIHAIWIMQRPWCEFVLRLFTWCLSPSFTVFFPLYNQIKD